MSQFAIVTCVLSLVIFSSFLALSIWRFGWLGSYSGYAAKWTEFLSLGGNIHTWSIVTMAVAVLLCFSTIEAGDESPLQFLGFFAPVYLGVVALTPKWESDKKQKTIHYIGTFLCAVAAILWLILVLRLWFYIPIALALTFIAAYFTKTIKTSYFLWLEIALFAAVYGALLIGG